jgi:hypothetical protein
MSGYPFHGLIETPFKIDSISPMASPDGAPGNWYEYVISQGPNSENQIRGRRSGTLSEVNSELLRMVEQLNERCGKLKKK